MKGHDVLSCWSKGRECRICKKEGHISKYCPAGEGMVVLIVESWGIRNTSAQKKKEGRMLIPFSRETAWR